MADETAPFFRFHPGAYRASAKAMERSNARCDLCRRPSGWRYTGIIYASDAPAVVCARCVADGRLSVHGDGHVQLHDIDLAGADPSLAREVLERTPGIACFNPYAWPVIDGEPLAFVGYGDDDEVLADPAVGDAISAMLLSHGQAPDRETPYALVFRQLDGTRVRTALDLD